MWARLAGSPEPTGPESWAGVGGILSEDCKGGRADAPEEAGVRACLGAWGL